MAESLPLETTPVLVGAGQAEFRDRQRLDEGDVLHPMDFAAVAARGALEHASGSDVAAAIDSITVIRMFEDSSPRRGHDFGRSNNPPRSLARRIGADPAEAVYSTAGGDTPQRKVNELCERIAGGEIDCALLCGVENVATVRRAVREGLRLDFEEQVDGSLDDEGFGPYWFDSHQLTHRVAAPIHCYPLLEHAIRRDRGVDVPTHLRSMAELFAPLSEVAARNPYAYRRRAYTADELAEVTGPNRLISHPYGRLLNARDAVDQSSAVLLMSAGRARALGVPQDHWVFLHGCSQASERPRLLDRPHLHRSTAARLMATTALDMAGLDVDDLASFDLYSCFPSAVEIVAREMGIAENDPRGLTTTGGLPYFGGPGNSYSLHAVAEAVERARRDPGTYHWVSANGGNVNKQTAGIYSTRPWQGEWKRRDPAVDQEQMDAEVTPPSTIEPEGSATVETYTVAFDGEDPSFGIVVGRLSDDRRFLATVPEDDQATLTALLESGFEVEGAAATEGGLSTFRAG